MRISPIGPLDPLLRPFAVGLLFGALSFGASPAFAQDDDEEDLLDEDEEEADDLDDGADSDAAPPSRAPSDDEDEPATAADGEPSEAAPAEAPKAATTAFEDVQTQYVIQGRARLLGSTFEIAPQLTQSVNDRFISHTGFMLSALYNIKENIAVELTGGTFFCWDAVDQEGFFNGVVSQDTGPRIGGCETDTTWELKFNERLQPEFVKLNRLTWVAAADVQWSPIYGKVSLQDLILGQFSLYLSVGAGFVGLYNDEAPEIANPIDVLYDTVGAGTPLGPVQLTASVGGGLRFYFLDWLGVRLELRDYVTPMAVLLRQAPLAPQSTFEVRNTLLVQLGLTFVIPAPWK